MLQPAKMVETRNRKLYFASDVHLGAPYITNGLEHEKRFVRWLDMAKTDATDIYLVGDIFDFWWEYKQVVPRGYVRTLAKLAEITEMGIQVHFFIGNHDMWVKDYLQNECGVNIHKTPLLMDVEGTKFHITHGDGLGDPSKMFQLIRAAFHNKFLQWAFETFVHPSAAIAFGKRWSGSSRKKCDIKHDSKFLGEDKEHLIVWAKNHFKENSSINYYIFGHRHIPFHLAISKACSVVVLGDFIRNFSYAVFSQGEMRLEFFEAD